MEQKREEGEAYSNGYPKANKLVLILQDWVWISFSVFMNFVYVNSGSGVDYISTAGLCL